MMTSHTDRQLVARHCPLSHSINEGSLSEAEVNINTDSRSIRAVANVATLHGILTVMIAPLIFIHTYEKGAAFSQAHMLGAVLTRWPELCILPVLFSGTALILLVLKRQKLLWAGMYLLLSLIALWFTRSAETLRTLGVVFAIIAASVSLVHVVRKWPGWPDLSSLRNFPLVSPALIVAFTVTLVCNSLYVLINAPDIKFESITDIGPVAVATGISLLVIGPIALGIWIILRIFSNLRHASALSICALAIIVAIWVATTLMVGARSLTITYNSALNVFIYFATGIVLAYGMALGWCSKNAMRLSMPQISDFEGRSIFRDLLLLLSVALVQWAAAYFNLVFAWGVTTAFQYTSVATALTLFALLHLRQRTLKRVVLAMGLWMLVTVPLAPWAASGAGWHVYQTFDKTMAAVQKIYFFAQPSDDPMDLQVRRWNWKSTHEPRAGEDVEVMPDKEFQRPRFVFLLVADALRASSYGRDTELPGIRMIRSEAVLYSNAWTNYNATSGALPSLFWGRLHSAWRGEDTGVDSNTMGAVMRAMGYRVVNFATYMGLSHYWPEAEQIGYSPGTSVKEAGDPEVVFNRVLSMIDGSRNKDQPTFYYLHTYNLHEPLYPRPGVPNRRQQGHAMGRLYEQNVAYFDRALKSFITELHSRDLWEDSLFILTSDHGEEMFEYGGVYHGWQINPEVMHIPLLIHFPKGTEGAARHDHVDDRLVSLIDILPTIFVSVGARVADQSALGGHNLLDLGVSTPNMFPLFNWDGDTYGCLKDGGKTMYSRNFLSGHTIRFSRKPEGWYSQKYFGKFPCDIGLRAQIEPLFRFK